MMLVWQNQLDVIRKGLEMAVVVNAECRNLSEMRKSVRVLTIQKYKTTYR